MFIYDGDELINSESDDNDDQGNGGTQTLWMLWGRPHELEQLPTCLMPTLLMVNPEIYTNALAKVWFSLNFDYKLNTSHVLINEFTLQKDLI